MIRNLPQLQKFNREYLAKEKFTYSQALKIFEGLFQEAKTLGVINTQNILEGLELDLRVAKTIHQLSNV